jgi:hypothetical protein
MINQIELRESQARINEMVENKIKFTTILKWLLILSALGFLIKFPDVVGHSIMWFIHIFYEATSFILEEFLRHNFGIDKDLAQLIVFYFSIITGAGAIIVLWRYWLKDYLLLKFYACQHQVIFYWHSKRTGEKIKLILIQSALVLSAFIFLFS